MHWTPNREKIMQRNGTIGGKIHTLYRYMCHRESEHLITVIVIGNYSLNHTHVYPLSVTSSLQKQLHYMKLVLCKTSECCIVFVLRKKQSYHSFFHGVVAEQLLLLLAQVFSFVRYWGLEKHLTCQLLWRCCVNVVLTLCWRCMGKDCFWCCLAEPVV